MSGPLRVLAVCVGRARRWRFGGRTVLSAIGKAPVEGRVAVAPLGLAGDEQADPAVHGGLAKAVYAYPAQHLPFWRTVRAQAGVSLWDTAEGGGDDTLPPGGLGENLLVEGLSEDRLWIGDRLIVGTPEAGCVLAVSEPRMPCFKFDAAMGFAQASRLMMQSGYCGAYLSVIAPGTVAAGDTITLEPGPREVNLRELFRARIPAGTAAR
jgi:MOSC domain-containing protein YiiM